MTAIHNAGRLPWGYRYCQVLASLARNPTLSDPRMLQNLPSSVAALEIIANYLDADLIQEGVRRGLLHPRLTRRTAVDVCRKMVIGPLGDWTGSPRSGKVKATYARSSRNILLAPVHGNHVAADVQALLLEAANDRPTDAPGGTRFLGQGTRPGQDSEVVRWDMLAAVEPEPGAAHGTLPPMTCRPLVEKLVKVALVEELLRAGEWSGWGGRIAHGILGATRTAIARRRRPTRRWR
ncbi:MAG: hypothetical protein KIS67_28465 [Verrucomicrobiae bacterium]|nr:hypothetical protein [Verrucomicrobiae bacterium]